MAMKRQIPLTSINGVAAGATATIDLPRGPLRYHRISLGYKTATAGGATEATIGSEITEIRLLINGKIQRRFTPSQLFNLNRQKGKSPTVSSSTSVPGYLTMFFTEPQKKSKIEAELTCWGMANVQSFKMEIDIAAGATSPVITGFAHVDDLVQNIETNGIIKWKKEIIQVAATGVLNYPLDVVTGDSYESVTFIENTAGDVSALLLQQDGLTIYQDDINVFVENLNIGDYTQVTKYRHVPLSGNMLFNVVPTVRKNPATGQFFRTGSFLAQLTMANAANVTAIREVLGAPD